ncbi:MAG: DUF1015 domain-containing protein [Armatimonadetes bacterium]|nr:DUF1015 domain-containing protein [Armatimonadota bacterium]
MATIRPFIAQRFSEKAGDLGCLVAPPYDLILPKMWEELAQASEYNTVRLTLPEKEPEDRSKFVRYARSASRLAEWRREGILKADDEPALYRYRQTFFHPLAGDRQTRTSIICLLKLEPYETGGVLPHEETFPKYKEDRLRLLEATMSHLECILGLYRDRNHRVREAIEGAPFEIVAQLETADGIEHELARCTNGEALERIVEALAPERVWIADGHHRYETALKFLEESKHAEGAGPEGFILMALCGMHDPGLALLPTHRIVTDFSLTEPQVHTRLQTYFNTRRTANEMLPSEVRDLALPNNRIFGIALPGRTGFIATMQEPREALRMVEEDASELYKMLDVTILHYVILQKVFGIEGLEQIEYTRDAGEAIRRVSGNGRTAAVITNPPRVQEMRQLSEGGEKMPQKSTYYYPKLLSGLVFWSLTDFR